MSEERTDLQHMEVKQPATMDQMIVRCFRCGWAWVRRDPTKLPEVCPNLKCKSKYWNQPRREKQKQQQEK